MRCLPSLRAGDRSSRVPLAPATAEALAVALLAEDIAAREETLSIALRDDAALAEWSRAAAGALGKDRVATGTVAIGPAEIKSGSTPTIAELARWLAPRLEDLLHWPLPGADHETATGEDGAIARLLPTLAQRLRRLKQLETRFDETLLAEKLEAMAEFAAGAGHEINNPLAVISGRAQLFLRHEKDPERRRELAVMNSQARRVYEMIADMMLFARPPRPRPEVCDVSALVDGLVADLAAKAAERGVSVVRCSPPARLVIQADRGQLIVALRAVCDNALLALADGGRIEISAQDSGDGVEITIRDNGPGIPPEVRGHLFDPFYSGRASGRGLGLGLSKCWRIVTNHGGTIEVDGPDRESAGHETTERGGASFTIRLPRGCLEPLAVAPRLGGTP